MQSIELLALTAAFAPALCASHFPHLPGAEARPLHAHRFHPRNYITEGTKSDSYDFVVAGGGLAGLVIASRLLEDANKTVLVLEAGGTGEDTPTKINVPASTYFDSLVGSESDWAYTTVSQSNAENRNVNWPRGRVLGGSSAINGMYYVHPSSVEIDAWRGMIAPQDSAGAEAWGWDQFYAAMKKSENFTPPKDEVQKAAGINYVEDTHGSGGPMHVTYPG